MNHVERSKFRGETWIKKFKPIEDPWQTCNREYGDFTPRKTVVKMENEVAVDEGPPIASTYQMGYNMKPEYRHKWMDSWKGYVKRKVPSKSAPYKSLKNIEKGRSPRPNPGIRLPPLKTSGATGASGAMSDRTHNVKVEKDIVLRDGNIYMPTRHVKPDYSRVNERFFNFQYKDIWMPLNFR